MVQQQPLHGSGALAATVGGSLCAVGGGGCLCIGKQLLPELA